MSDLFLLAGAGLLAGAMNAMAGGGSFVTLPALIAAGVPSVAANASSTVALYPGGAASAYVYRSGFDPICGAPAGWMLAVTLAGGLAGALLLLWTPTTMFDQLLPWLLLVATLMLAAGPRLGAALRARLAAGPLVVLAIQVLLGLYGGYFGGAVGLMMIAAWSLLDGADFKALNPSRTLMVTAANTAAVLCFALAGAVHWPQTLIMGGGALAGGYLGAQAGRRLPSGAVRFATLAIAVGMTVAFFVRAYGRG
ncbi:sulfite exporter TauE/SafE family protein [Labrys portucalensis]|uniref:Probable membrane transporter protein n=1 Tax=Labrys neptuniae TaxID=376174 RepID=A0ABV6ZS38_9HYPH